MPSKIGYIYTYHDLVIRTLSLHNVPWTINDLTMQQLLVFLQKPNGIIPCSPPELLLKNNQACGHFASHLPAISWLTTWPFLFLRVYGRHLNLFSIASLITQQISPSPIIVHLYTFAILILSSDYVCAINSIASDIYLTTILFVFLCSHPLLFAELSYVVLVIYFYRELYKYA